MKIVATFAPHLNSWYFSDAVEDMPDVDEFRSKLIDYTNVDNPPEVLTQQQIEHVETIIRKHIPDAVVEIKYDHLTT